MFSEPPHWDDSYGPKGVTFVYDRLNSAGGAEKVLAALLEAFPEATIASSVHVSQRTPWLDPTRVHTSWLQMLAPLRNHHRLLGWLMPVIFEHLSLPETDVIISVSSEAAKGVRVKPHQLHIDYTLTPTRYLWSHHQDYMQQIPHWLRPLARRITKCLQQWDYQAAQRPNQMIPISQLVGQRIQQYYDRQPADVIYPPVEPLPLASRPGNPPVTANFFFTWGRHVPYKRFDQCIRAAALMGETLVIAGSGPDTKRLKTLAEIYDPLGQHVFFVDRIPDSELHWYLQRARAAIFPQVEDFGITIMEAQLAGCPVVVHSNSGAAECILAAHAVLLPDGTLRSLQLALQEVRRRQFSRLDIQRHARQYAGVQFAKQWQQLVHQLWNEFQAESHPKIERSA